MHRDKVSVIGEFPQAEMNKEGLIVRGGKLPALSYEEVVKKNKEVFIKDTLHNFEVLMDTVGVDEVFKRMEGDTFWKLYTYFKNTVGDSDR